MPQQRSHPLGVSSAGGSGVLGEGHAVDTGSRARVNGLDRWLARTVAKRVGNPPVAFVLWDGTEAYCPSRDRIGAIAFGDRGALWSVVASPELGFGDCVSAGRIGIEGDLVEVLTRLNRAVDGVGVTQFKRSLLGRLPRPRRNTYQGSKKHIHHHYDLGNDFYRLWLDERLVYTCAYYQRPNTTLEEAQIAKMHHVCRKVGLAPGLEVVEAGCGWGSLALHMARHYGVRVRAFNISSEQITYARERARAEGLDNRVTFIEDDYRNISGRCDAFVSVGMLEHVGPEHYQDFGRTVSRVLSGAGRGLIHSVGRNVAMPVNAWLERRVFPGSYPPSLREMMGIFEPYKFSIVDVENLRLHYARTLVEWLERFDSHADDVRRTYDESFVRAWRLYLAGCAASFIAGSTQLFQVVFAHQSNNRMPYTRGELYHNEKDAIWGFE